MIECTTVLEQERKKLFSESKIQPISNLPTHEEILQRRFNNSGNSRDITIKKTENRKNSWEIGVCVVVSVIIGVIIGYTIPLPQ